MNKIDLKIVKCAYRILDKEINDKKYRCKEYCFGCSQCAFTQFMKEFNSIITEYLEDSIK